MMPMNNIQYYDYPEKILFKQVYADLDKQIAKEGHGHLSEIRWLKGIDFRPSRNDAIAFLKEYNKGNCGCLAVKYIEVPSGVSTDAYAKCLDRYQRASKKLMDLKKENFISDMHSEYFECRNCGSKINREVFLSNHPDSKRCPVCSADLRPASQLERIQNERKALDDLYDQMTKEKRRIMKCNPTIRWLVRIEFCA
jgi:hypothetical protein